METYSGEGEFIYDFGKYANILERIEEIRKACDGRLELPQICVVGDQSAGKSSLLASISGIKFPEASGMCTKCPIIVRLEKKFTTVVKISYLDKETCLDDLTELSQAITAAQEELILLNPGKRVVETPINIILSAPDRTPLTLIDLPGIVHNSEGEIEIENMIRKWIAPENTLILLVRTANSDDENVKALKIVHDYDRYHKRTIQVYTKCDKFESDERRNLIKAKLLQDSQNQNGCHVVACRIDGLKFDPVKEMTIFKRDKYFTDIVSNKGIGVEQLKTARLPDLLRERIMTNWPSLNSEIGEKMRNASDQLYQIGWESKSQDQIISKLMDLLKPNYRVIQERTTRNFKEFQSKIAEETLKATKTYCDQYYRENMFKVVYFYGENAFNEIIQSITVNFDAHCDTLIDQVNHH
jgi:GTP-binding protein EngB required for normal cell division